MLLDFPLEKIHRITPFFLKKLRHLGIKNIQDLIYYFPRRYDDFSNIKNIANLQHGETATVRGKISEIKNIKTWKKRFTITEAHIQDDEGMIKAIWFNQPFLAKSLKENTTINISGKISLGKNGLYFSNPAYEVITNESQNFRHTGCLVPVYPETAGISSRYIRYLIQNFFPAISEIADNLPTEIKKSQKLIGIKTALRQIHFPENQETANSARQRLSFDELFLIQLFSLQQKITRQREKAAAIKFDQKLIKNFVESLPFKLTNSQKKSAWEILQDLQKTSPMNRLLEGDVGSGKTVVAAMAALQTAKANYQTAIMAPTEILAKQHFKSFCALLNNQAKIALLTSNSAKINNSKKISKKDLISKIKNGQTEIVIGTHALLQKNIKFKNLALAIIDEQHRFGVRQRAALQNEINNIKDELPSEIPHFLSMTATPIPRTLALTIYGDLDISLINEMPLNRKNILTKIVNSPNRQNAYEFIRQQIKTGRQAFVICPRIEKKEEKEKYCDNLFCNNQENIKAAKEEFEKLKKIFPEYKISLLHGKMKPREKENAMESFAENKTQILVSTSVVEVGVDIPNANVIIIEDANKFGLAQLHQFRGRVGRGSHQSYCLLFSSSNSENRRLNALVKCQDGFALAEKDLKIRGPGEFYGSRQCGMPDLSMASLSDTKLIIQARQEALILLQKNPDLNNYPLLKEKLKKFTESIHLE